MRIIIICVSIALSACASTTPHYVANRQVNLITPVIDTTVNPKGRDMGQDLKECNYYANSIAGPGMSAMNSGMAGAALGAAVGAITAAYFGADVGYTAGFGALTGGIGGAAGGAAKSVNTKYRVVANCMSGRGYSVLN